MQKIIKTTACFLTCCSFLSLFPNAASADVTLSGTVRYWDSRTDRSDGVVISNTGSRLTTVTQNTNRPARMVEIDVWDRDGSCIDFETTCFETDDDFLAGVTTSITGYYQVDLGLGEDVYLVTDFTNDVGQARPNSATELVVFGREVTDISFNTTYNWNITCFDDSVNTTNGLCNNAASVGANFSDAEDHANMLATMHDTFNLVDSTNHTLNGHTNPINGYTNHASCSTPSSGTSWDYNSFCVGSDNIPRNHMVAHEIGHLIHRRALNYSGKLGYCQNGWDWPSHEGERCATAEGWASFFAGAVYFTPSALDPYFDVTDQVLEGDTTSANSGIVSDCVSDLNSPHRRPGNVARFFWDILDSTTENEGSWSGDNSNESLIDIIAVWDDFESGTTNRKNNEDNYNGSHGRNAKDYEDYDSSTGIELNHNCLDNQDDG